MTTILLPFLAIWSFLGLLLMYLYVGGSDMNAMKTHKLLILIFVCGPIVWVFFAIAFFFAWLDQ